VTGAPPVVLVFTIPEENHFALLQPLIAGLVEEGATVHVFGDLRNLDGIEQAGAHFVDLYGRYSLEAADDESVPLPSRSVTYAGTYAEDVVCEAAALEPTLVVYDLFAVIGKVVGQELGIPAAAIVTGHNLNPQLIVAELEADPRVAVGRRCLAAVEVLRARYGLTDASPFSYVTGLSRSLNVCCEPRSFLTASERSVFEPAAFYGSLPVRAATARDLGAPRLRSGRSGNRPARRVLACFGTIVWRYYAREALAVLMSIVDALADLDGVEGLISLGGAVLPPDRVTALERPNVRVVPWIDQFHVLQETDLFITHNGLASTHEAIFHGVPMLSVPFFWDQPRLASRCRELGLASPLTEMPFGTVSPDTLRDAFLGPGHDDRTRGAAFAIAQRWERETLAGRPSVHRRILRLAGRPRPLGSRRSASR